MEMLSPKPTIYTINCLVRPSVRDLTVLAEFSMAETAQDFLFFFSA
jgi:hypothetical protein